MILYIRESRVTLGIFHYTLGWLGYEQISNIAHGCYKKMLYY